MKNSALEVYGNESVLDNCPMSLDERPALESLRKPHTVDNPNRFSACLSFDSRLTCILETKIRFVEPRREME